MGLTMIGKRQLVSIAALGIILGAGTAVGQHQTTTTATNGGKPETSMTSASKIAPGTFEIRGLKGLFWDGIDKYNAAIEWMPDHGMNWLMLCYTAFPESARDWRKDYTPQHIDQMRRLVTRANDLGVTVCLSFNPGIWSDPPLVHSSEEDYQAAWRKIKVAHEIGIREIALCLDDINRALQPADLEKYGTLEAAQVDFTNRIWRDMKALAPGMRLIFCPSAYTTADMEAHQQYIQTIGKELDREIEIFWTGPDVVSKTITADDAQKVAQWLRRKPFIWDNYPVNDMFWQTPRPWQPLLAPLEGRSGDLPDAVSGILFNPMKQWEASRIPLVSVASYLRDPAGYNPDKQRESMLNQYEGPAREAVSLLMKHYGSTFVGEDGYPPLPKMDTSDQRAEARKDLQRIKEILTAGTDEMKQLWDDVKETVEKDLEQAVVSNE